MKRFVILLVLCAVLVGGCSGVIMNAKYSMLLDQTAATSVVTAQLANTGQLTADDMKVALTKQSEAWLRFKDAKDGKAGAQ